MQANGAEMLRVAAILATERGIRVCAPVHDAFLIEAPLAELDHAVAQMRAAMAEASAGVLAGFTLRSDVELIRYPDRYCDPRGAAMWETVTGLLNGEDGQGVVHGFRDKPARNPCTRAFSYISHNTISSSGSCIRASGPMSFIEASISPPASPQNKTHRGQEKGGYHEAAEVPCLG
jgi:hypothetical protein